MIVSESEPHEHQSPAAPPIWSLPLALLLVAAVLLPFFLDWGELGAVRRMRNGHGRPRVVALGNSFLRAATGQTFDVPDAARDRGLDLVWARVSQPGQGWDFDGSLERLVAARPDLLLIADNVIFHPPRGPEFELDRVTFGVFVRDTSRYLDRFLVRNGLPFLARDPSARIGSPLLDDLGAVRLRAMHERTFVPLSAQRLAPLRRARSQGTQVAVLVMPLSVAGLATFAERGTVEKALQQLPVDEGIAVWRCPLEFADADFHDGRHMVPAASQRYIAWLLETIDGWWRKQAER